jgi:7-cyano-7-deazaguanine synthase
LLKHDIIDLKGITHLISNSALTTPYDIMDGRVIEVPEGHYAKDSMKATVVPNRNMMMLAIAGAVAINEKAECIGIGIHAGDHWVYPDCRPQFITQFELALMAGNEGFHNFPYGIKGGKSLATAEPETVEVKGHVVTHNEQFYKEAHYGFFGDVGPDDFEGPVYAPFIMKSKADIAYRALELGVPLHLTWSCYKGAVSHCGKCGTCVERLEAIDIARQRVMKKSPGLESYPIDYTVYDDSEFWKTAIRDAHI